VSAADPDEPRSDAVAARRGLGPLVTWRALPPVTRRALGVFALAVGAAIVTAAFGWYEAPHGYYDFKGAPWSDALWYHLDAIDLTQGYGLRESFFPLTVHLPRAPGYIVWLSTIYSIFGTHAGPTVVRALNVLTYGGVAVVTYRLGARAFGERVGLLCGAAVALARTGLDFTQYLMTEVPTMGLCALALWLCVREREREQHPDADASGRATAGRRLFAIGVAGLALGAATTMRTVAGIALPLSALYLVWGRLRGRQARRAALVLCAAALLPISALMARDEMVAGTPTIAATTHVWTAWAEFVPPSPDADDARYAEALYPRADESDAEIQAELSAGFYGYIGRHPLAYARRVYYLLLSNLRMPPFSQALDLVGVVGVLLVLLGLCGATRARRKDVVALLAALTLTTLLGNALFGNSSGRFRIPVDSWLMLLVGGGLLHALGVGRGDELAPSTELAGPRLPLRTVRLLWGGAVFVPVAAVALSLVLAALSARHVVLPPSPTEAAAQATREVTDPALAQALATSAAAGTPTYSMMRRSLINAASDPSALDGTLVVWTGEVTPIAHLDAGEGDDRSPLTGSADYGRTVAMLLADGNQGGRDGQHVWLEIPDGVQGADLAGPVLVVARLALEPRSFVYERFRLRALALLPRD
jgi:hypothetical protein